MAEALRGGRSGRKALKADNHSKSKFLSLIMMLEKGGRVILKIIVTIADFMQSIFTTLTL